MKLTIGTRGSNLAIAQTQEVVNALMKICPETDVEIKKIKTTGDKIQDTTLHDIGGKALFVKELEMALKEGEIDLAVHSMKDVPGEIHGDFEIFPVLARANPKDVLIAKNNHNLDTLPLASTVATSSLRRKAQLLAYRKDLNIVPIRGNINTRIEKFRNSQEIEAIVLAKAGIDRLALDVDITQILTTEVIVPCVGQGALGIEILKENQDLMEKLKVLQDENVEKCVAAERAFLQRLGGSCYVPVGAYAELIEASELSITGVVAGLDGQEVLKDTERGPLNAPSELGKNIAEKLLAEGADRILKEIEQEVE